MSRFSIAALVCVAFAMVAANSAQGEFATWRLPEGGSNPDVVQTSDGVVHVVYVKEGRCYYARAETPGGAWSGMAPLSKLGEKVSSLATHRPKIARGRSESLHVIWRSVSIWYARSTDAGDHWDAPARIPALEYSALVAPGDGKPAPASGSGHSGSGVLPPLANDERQLPRTGRGNDTPGVQFGGIDDVDFDEIRRRFSGSGFEDVKIEITESPTARGPAVLSGSRDGEICIAWLESDFEIAAGSKSSNLNHRLLYVRSADDGMDMPDRATRPEVLAEHCCADCGLAMTHEGCGILRIVHGTVGIDGHHRILRAGSTGTIRTHDLTTLSGCGEMSLGVQQGGKDLAIGFSFAGGVACASSEDGGNTYAVIPGKSPAATVSPRVVWTIGGELAFGYVNSAVHWQILNHAGEAAESGSAEGASFSFLPVEGGVIHVIY